MTPEIQRFKQRMVEFSSELDNEDRALLIQIEILYAMEQIQYTLENISESIRLRPLS